MKILFICVNYNSYNELQNYLESIDSAACEANSPTVDVMIADNSSELKDIPCSLYNHILVKRKTFPNVGYLGAAQAIINEIDNIEDYDFVVISNVDILMAPDFLIKLETKKISEDIAWVATKIWSEDEKRDRNPKVLRRYSKRKLQFINLLYRYPILDWIYTNTMYRRKKIYNPSPECDLYAGHGSFMLFTRSFFKHYTKIHYPIFLFGEEVFFAELITKAGLRVHYYPDLVVNDMEHVSTGKMKKKFYYKCNKESVDYILKTFYNE